MHALCKIPLSYYLLYMNPSLGNSRGREKKKLSFQMPQHAKPCTGAFQTVAAPEVRKHNQAATKVKCKPWAELGPEHGSLRRAWEAVYLRPLNSAVCVKCNPSSTTH